MTEHYAKVYFSKSGDICSSPDEPRYCHEYRRCSNEFEARMMAAGHGGQYGVLDVPMLSVQGIDIMFRVVTDYGKASH